MQITKIKSIWPENQGFDLYYENVGDEYVFIHFLSPAVIWTNGMKTSVNRGGCIIHDKFSMRRISAPDCPLMHNWFHLTGDISHILSRYSVVPNKVYYPENDDHITMIIQNMEIEFMSKGSHWERICTLGVEEIVARMSRQAETFAPSANAVKKEALIQLRTKVHLTYYEEWTVPRMASEAGMSVSRFYADYGKVFGISPSKDLQNTRIEHAKRFLLSGMGTEQTAEKTGFGTTYHFIRKFRQQCGVTPGKYRSGNTN